MSFIGRSKSIKSDLFLQLSEREPKITNFNKIREISVSYKNSSYIFRLIYNPGWKTMSFEG